jgi:hypothetical protein
MLPLVFARPLLLSDLFFFLLGVDLRRPPGVVRRRRWRFL